MFLAANASPTDTFACILAHLCSSLFLHCASVVRYPLAQCVMHMPSQYGIAANASDEYKVTSVFTQRQDASNSEINAAIWKVHVSHAFEHNKKLGASVAKLCKSGDGNLTLLLDDATNKVVVTQANLELCTRCDAITTSLSATSSKLADLREQATANGQQRCVGHHKRLQSLLTSLKLLPGLLYPNPLHASSHSLLAISSTLCFSQFPFPPIPSCQFPYRASLKFVETILGF